MFWLIILQVITLTNTFSQQIYCSEGQIGLFEKTYFPSNFDSEKLKWDYTLPNYQELIEYLGEYEINTTHSQNLIFSSSINNKLVQVYKGDDELFTIYFYEIQLDIFNIQNVQVKLKISDIIQLKLINSINIENIYKQQQNLIIVFNEQAHHLLYWFKNETNYQNKNFILQNQYIIQKKDNCENLLIQDDNNFFLYFSYVNCLDWEIYSVNSDGLELININDRHNNLILQRIHSHIHLYLIFPQIVYQLEFDFSYQIIIYENSQKQKIVSFFSKSQTQKHYSIIIKDDKQSINLIDNNIITSVKEKPKQHLAFNDKIYLLFDDHIMCIENFDSVYSIPLKIDFLIFSYEFQPYFFGLTNSKIFVIVKNQHFPFFNCEQIKNNKTLYFKESNFNKYQFNERSVDLIFIKIDEKKFLKPLELLKKKIIKYLLYKNDLKLSFPINYINYYNNYRLNFNLINDNQISCNVQEDFEQTKCKIDKDQVLWTRIDQNKTTYFMVFQTKQLSLYIKDCETEFQLFLGNIDEINQQNIKVLQQSYVLLNQEQNKIYAINIRSFPNITLKILEFEQKIISIQQKKIVLIVFLEQCRIFCFDQINIFITSDYCNDIQLASSCKNNSKIFNKFVVSFENQFFTLRKENINIIMDLKVDQIIDFMPLEKFNENAILAFYQNNEFWFSKITFFQNQFVFNFKLPKYNFTYLSPPIYYQNGQMLIVVAQKLIDNQLIYFLLIYKLDNILQEILVDVIQNIDITNFYIIGDSTIIFQRNGMSYIRILGEVEINCQLQKIFFENSKTFNMQTIVSSKIFDDLSLNNSLIIKVFNRIENLYFKNGNNKTISLDKDSNIDFDIKQFIFGPINQILSENIDIEYPLKFIMNIDCDQIYQNYCLLGNKIVNYLINETYSYFIKTHDRFLVLSNQIIIYQSNLNYCEMKIFDNKFNFLYQLTLNEYVIISETKIIDNYLIIMVFDRIDIYILGETLLYIQGIVEHSNNFAIQKVSNKQNAYILYHDQHFLSQISYMYLNNENKFDLIMLQILTESNQLMQIFHILIQSIIDYDNYMIAKVLLIQDVEYSYLINAKIDLIEGTFELQEKLLEIRIQNAVNLQVLVSPNQFGFLGQNYFFFVDYTDNFYLYNISINQEFQTIDPIYCISQYNTKLQIINETLILFESIDSRNHQIYEVSSYFFKISNKSNDKYSIKIINNVSELEFFFLVNNESSIKMLNLFIYIFIGILFLFFGYQVYKKINYRNHYKFEINQNQSEIEL